MALSKPFYNNINISDSCLQRIPEVFSTNVYIACSMRSPIGYLHWDSLFPEGYTVINFSGESGPYPITINSQPIIINPQTCKNVFELILGYLQRKTYGNNSIGYYLEWVDHSADTDRELLYSLAIYFAYNLPKTLIIQCGAGLGRSATFTALLISVYFKITGYMQQVVDRAGTQLLEQIVINLVRKYRPGAIYKRSQRKLIRDFVQVLTTKNAVRVSEETFHKIYDEMVKRYEH